MPPFTIDATPPSLSPVRAATGTGPPANRTPSPNIRSRSVISIPIAGARSRRSGRWMMCAEPPAATAVTVVLSTARMTSTLARSPSANRSSLAIIQAVTTESFSGISAGIACAAFVCPLKPGCTVHTSSLVCCLMAEVVYSSSISWSAAWPAEGFGVGRSGAAMASCSIAIR
jgi:hypothetical protein